MWRGRRSALLLVAAAAVCPDASTALWGGTGSEVIDLTLHKDVKRIKKSPYAWGIALYRDGCGYCELLKPEWTNVAAKMRKMAGIAAVDVVTHQHIAQSLMQEYGFEVKGVPTVIILKPSPDGKKKEMEVYNGERKLKPILKAVTNAMPEFVARITEPSFAGWQQKPGAKIVLFTKKREPSRELKALSTKYRDRNVSFGIVDQSDTALRALFGVDTVPKLVAIESGQRVGEGGYQPIEYTRGNTFVSLDFFVMDFAAPKPAGEEGGTESMDGDSSASGASSPAGATKSKSKKPKASSKSKSKSKSGSSTKRRTPSSSSSSSSSGANTYPGGNSPSSPSSAPSNKGKRRSPALSGKLRRLPQPADPITLKGTDLTKLSVKQLRGILARWDDACTSCLEKSNFIERIEKHRAVYGDMEAIAQRYAEKAKTKNRRAAAKRKRAAAASAGEGGGAGGGGGDGGVDGDAGDGNDDPFCTRMLEVETGPLQDRIAELEAENTRLRRQLELVAEPLIHDDL
eukprot:m.116327 g.116327  ORF g.116327 m.116327 type:complete len:514 (+) comp10914_c0_seq2:331-1872(+)